MSPCQSVGTFNLEVKTNLNIYFLKRSLEVPLTFNIKEELIFVIAWSAHGTSVSLDQLQDDDENL